MSYRLSGKGKLSPDVEMIVEKVKEKRKAKRTSSASPSPEVKIPKYVPLQEYEKLSLKQAKSPSPSQEESALVSLQSYLESRSNLIVVQYSEWNTMMKNLEKFYSISIPKSNKDTAIEKFVELILTSDPNLYIEKSNIKYRKSIDTFLILKIDNVKFRKIFEDDLLIKDFTNNSNPEYILLEDNFPYIQFTGVFVNSLNFIYDYRFNNTDLILLNYSCDFEKRNLGSIMYMEYFSNKYSNKICNTIDKGIEQIFERMNQYNLEIEDFINQYWENVSLFFHNKSKEEKTFYDSFWSKYNTFYRANTINISLFICKNEDWINCNWYYLMILIEMSEKIKTENTIFYDDSSTLYISDKLDQTIKKCLNSNEPYILIYLIIKRKRWDGGQHANILLIDKQRNLVERFEPHGSASVSSDTDLNVELWDYFSKLGIRYKYDLCSVSGIQNMEWKIPKDLIGKCVSLSFGYLDHRLNEIAGTKRQLPAEYAPISYYKTAKEKGIIHWYDINTFNFQLFNEFQKYLEYINNKYGTCLLFRGNLLTFYNKDNSKCKC
jgi:hypothetical protein